MIKDGAEQVVSVKSKPDATHIVVDLVSNTHSDSYITGNAKISEEDFSIIDEYARYKNMAIITASGQTSVSWTQG